MDLKRIETAIHRYVKPIDHPLAVRMLKKGDVPPADAKRPLKDFGAPLALCQAFALCRKEGLGVVLDRESQLCPIALAGLGFARPEDFLSGEFVLAPVNQTVAARKRRCQEMPRFNYGQYEAILIAPLAACGFEPDIVLVYGSGAQVMRMIQAAVFFDGSSVSSTSAGSGGCMLPIAGVMGEDACKYVIPGNGERRLGLVADGEMAFSMPKRSLDKVAEGLKLSHHGKQGFPISPGYLKSEYTMPPSYRELRQAMLDRSMQNKEEPYV